MSTGARIFYALGGLALAASGLWGLVYPSKASDAISAFRDSADPITKRVLQSQTGSTSDLRSLARLLAIGLLIGGLVFLGVAIFSHRS